LQAALRAVSRRTAYVYPAKVPNYVAPLILQTAVGAIGAQNVLMILITSCA